MVTNTIFTRTFKLDFVEVLPDRLIMIEKKQATRIGVCFLFLIEFAYLTGNYGQKKDPEISEPCKILLFA